MAVQSAQFSKIFVEDPDGNQVDITENVLDISLEPVAEVDLDDIGGEIQFYNEIPVRPMIKLWVEGGYYLVRSWEDLRGALMQFTWADRETARELVWKHFIAKFEQEPWYPEFDQIQLKDTWEGDILTRKVRWARKGSYMFMADENTGDPEKNEDF